MSLIPEPDQARLRQDFAAMSEPVTLIFFTRASDCATCAQTRQILDEIPPLAPLVSIDQVDFDLEPARAAAYAIDRAPAIAIVRRAEDGSEHDSHIRFLGTPSGYEFISLVRAILLVGGGPSMLSDESRRKLAAIDRPMAMHVFSTPTCPHCPRAVTLAHEVAWANPRVTAYAVEATEHPDLARTYRVTGVPKTVINDRTEILGAVPEDEFIDQTVTGFTAAPVEGHA